MAARAGGKKARDGAGADWSAVAQWYDDLVGEAGTEYHQRVVIPGLLRLLGDGPGKTVIDIACGQGVLCRTLLAAQMEVTGVDAAPDLIDAARRRGPQSIRYHTADARDLSFLPAHHFWGAVCVLAIQNINPVQGLFASVRRVLEVRGRLVVVMMHPCFRGAKETSWGWDTAQGLQYRRVDRYLMPRKVPIVTHPGQPGSPYTWTFHRPLETYLRALRQAGFMVDALEEWPSHKRSQPGPRAAAENRARDEIPMFLALRAVAG